MSQCFYELAFHLYYRLGFELTESGISKKTHEIGLAQVLVFKLFRSVESMFGDILLTKMIEHLSPRLGLNAVARGHPLQVLGKGHPTENRAVGAQIPIWACLFGGFKGTSKGKPTHIGCSGPCFTHCHQMLNLEM